MKKGVKIFLLFLFLGLIVLAAYFYVNPKKALNIIIPEVEDLSNIHVNLAQDTAYITIAAQIKNKGLFKLNLDSLIYHVKLDTATLLSKAQFLNEKLKPSQSDKLLLPIALPYKRLQAKIKDLQGQDSVDVQIDLEIVYSTLWGETTLPYTKTIRIEVPTPPKFDIEKVEYIKREKKTGYFMAHVRMHNYGKININISDVRYNMIVKDLFEAEGQHPEVIQIKPKSDILMKLPVKVEFKKLLKTISMIITDNDQVTYRFKLNAFIQNDNVGPDKTPIVVEKTGTLELKE